jgi:hypothetical protein
VSAIGCGSAARDAPLPWRGLEKTDETFEPLVPGSVAGMKSRRKRSSGASAREHVVTEMIDVRLLVLVDVVGAVRRLDPC